MRFVPCNHILVDIPSRLEFRITAYFLHYSQHIDFRNNMEKVPMTTRGFVSLEEELKNLKTKERPSVIQAIAEAREHGDLKENAEYHAAREKQGFIEGRIQEIEDKIARAEVIDVSKLSGPKIKFGATVKLMDTKTDDEIAYQIVGEYEADLEKGLISLSSPIARGLIGKEEGDEVTIAVPGGKKTFEILDVVYK